MNVTIPNDPAYFLKINYGHDYATCYKSSDYSHKDEKRIGKVVTVRKLHDNKYTIVNNNQDNKKMGMKFL